MKTAQQIREEIKACEIAITQHQHAYKVGSLPKETMLARIQENRNVIMALEWVLSGKEEKDG